MGIFGFMHFRWKDSCLVWRLTDNSFNTCLTLVWYFGVRSDDYCLVAWLDKFFHFLKIFLFIDYWNRLYFTTSWHYYIVFFFFWILDLKILTAKLYKPQTQYKENRGLNTFEMWWCRRMLKIKWMDRIINKDDLCTLL